MIGYQIGRNRENLRKKTTRSFINWWDICFHEYVDLIISKTNLYFYHIGNMLAGCAIHVYVRVFVCVYLCEFPDLSIEESVNSV